MNSEGKSGFFNTRNAHELVRLAKKLLQENKLPQAIATFQAAINEYKQYLISLKYIEEDMTQIIRELQHIVARLKATQTSQKKEPAATGEIKETPKEEPVEQPPEHKLEVEREARRVIYQAKKVIDDLMLEAKKGLEFSLLKQKVDHTYHDFKQQLSDLFGKDVETIKVYLRWLDNLINDLQKTILERKVTAPAPPETKPAAEKNQTKKGGIGEGYKILLVDDEPDVLITLEFLLKNEGFEVFKATSGSEGIKSAQQDRPDLIILDIKMPGISGYEAAQTIKEDPDMKKTPIIFLTAVSQVVDPTYGIKTEVVADRYVSKPYDIDNFLKIIRELLHI